MPALAPRRILLTALAILILCPAADAGSLLQGSEITHRSVLERLNFFRGMHGLGPLRLDERLNRAAEKRIDDMAEQGYWAHVSPSGTSPFVWLKPSGYRMAAAGENLATGFETAEVLVDSWMESPGHRRNILSGLYSEVGIAIIDGAIDSRAPGRSVVVIFATENLALVSTSASSDRPRRTSAAAPPPDSERP